MFPLDFGNSTCMVSVAADEVAPAVASVERLLAHVGYRGIFSAEFKYDERDGLFKILEVNARPWWYVEFTARCGVDVCTLAYRDALGEAVGAGDGLRGRANVRVSVLRLRRLPRAAPPGRAVGVGVGPLVARGRAIGVPLERSAPVDPRDGERGPPAPPQAAISTCGRRAPCRLSVGSPQSRGGRA